MDPHNRHIIEVPLYAYSVERLLHVMCSFPVDVCIYGGYPDSPFNGGRSNFLLDGRAGSRPFGGSFSKAFIEKVRLEFWDMICKANRNGIPFFLTFTNMFCDPEELNPVNLEPVMRLVQSGRRNAISNGVIINNALLERTIRDNFTDDLIFISSCTKYVLPDRLLLPQESINWYLADYPNYDYVVITPQLSKDRQVLQQLAGECPGKFIAIANTYCSSSCNSHHHYEYTSRQNKIPLELLNMQYEKAKAIAVFEPLAHQCSAIGQMNNDMHLRDKVQLQLEAGMRHFKIGRGIGQDCLEELAGIIYEYDNHHRLRRDKWILTRTFPDLCSRARVNASTALQKL